MKIWTICFLIMYCLDFSSSTIQLKDLDHINLRSLNSLNRSKHFSVKTEKSIYTETPERFAFEKSPVHEYFVWHAPTPSIGQPWPHPKTITKTPNIFPVSNTLTFIIFDKKCELIISSIDRYKKRIFLDKIITHVTIDSISKLVNSCKHNKIGEKCKIRNIFITVKSCSNKEYPNENMDESYQLKVTRARIDIICQQTWGLLRALETLAQLVFLVIDIGYNWLAISETSIIDKPKYKHRGLMIDTSRHFIPVEKLLENLSGMEMNKLNVFHWHISDDQSFPFQSQSHPELYINGSFHLNFTYSYSQIRFIVEYARQRGIRVIPELDVPGHTASWIKSHPELMSECRTGFKNQNKFFGPLNPIIKETYFILKDLYSELFELFPDNHIHIGLDEVGKGCWSSDPDIKEFMRINKIDTAEWLIALFINKLQKLINENFPKKKLIVWEEASEKWVNLTKNSIIQIWKTRVDSFQTINKNFPIIYSSSFYLDHTSYGTSWVQFYVNDFENYAHLNVIGGEACMWNEFQSKETITQTIWPAMCAISEILWYGRRNTLTVASQLEEQRCRMLRSGITVGVGSGPSECLFLPEKSHLNVNISCPHTYLNNSFQSSLGLIKFFVIFTLGFVAHCGVQIIRNKKKFYSHVLLIVLFFLICLHALDW